ncbi:MAG TPA: hypothetical protein VJR89_04310, partial [Polyangiales bacterium]|nr:hypothetical protein [Polyangiales bacterium]
MARGAGGADADAARRALGLDAASEDKLFARALVSTVAQACVPALPARPSSQPPSAEASAADSGGEQAAAELGPATASRSFAMRGHGPAAALNVARLDDLRTLLLIVRSGSLFERRQSVQRIGALLTSGAAVASDVRRETIEVLTRLQHTELAHDIGVLLARLPGG